jgi:hypothetical protein
VRKKWLHEIKTQISAGDPLTAKLALYELAFPWEMDDKKDQ